VKTRLASERGDRDALLLYTGFLLDSAETCRRWHTNRVASDPNRRLVIYVDPGPDDPVLAEVARRAGGRLVAQPEGDLGDRLRFIFDEEFGRGARAVCAVGSDSPTLPAHMIDHAFRALAWERVALGPTFDGGYWLVGAQRPAPDLFSNIPWSTPEVLQRTLTLLRGQGLEGHLLPFWYDIDEDKDLERLVWHVRALRAAQPGALPNTWDALVRTGLVRDDAEERAA
jgi:rSAM/selenodomain-associated transferase 1